MELLKLERTHFQNDICWRFIMIITEINRQRIDAFEADITRHCQHPSVFKGTLVMSSLVE
ncbi:hypothetical protein PHLCEN_2v893 [Hermanssonia centrifuga]|uniref:Uncharacterized protein n=1 Tax=Hermanssonia centrifuga TaxID=98765 RepID=A0A2R6S4T0_9APHY|nr:hypothetical protein PHLCEN_2v893 [Hermanssonia centrifuga]